MERIYVTVRPRPLSIEDAKSSPWRISGNSISLSNNQSNNKFDFDRIFQEECETKQVYEARTKDIVAAAVRGFNGTVFAYGQTNSGKTHTMRGSAIEPGVIPLAVHDLFNILQEDVDREFLLRMSYMEIYNEEINDLLAPEHRKLQIHDNLERGIFVAGLREEIVATPEQVLDFMEFGESHRHIGETNMNVYSSRSHTIFRMIIESRIKAEDGDVGIACDAVRVSVLNLVDLAGSERAAKTGAEGMRLKEGSHINKSLMTLGTVIKKLSEGAESQGGHVPYRDSKLTRILQPSLGGNANTAIICNITLAQIHADETKSSLQFASRALRVTNCARVNEILTDAALLKRQKKEIEDLRARLQGSHTEHFEEEILSLRNTLLQSELERERIALELHEEKKAKALKERRLQEQAKKIENLSSMVLNSNVDEKHFACKKDKRRETWCPSLISWRIIGEGVPTTQETDILEPIRPDRGMGLLLPFKELVNDSESLKDHIPEDGSALGEQSSSDLSEDCTLPDPRSLLNVTSRKRAPAKKNVVLQKNVSFVTQADYEDLLIELESQRIMKDIEIDCLTKKLSFGGYLSEGRSTGFLTCQLDGSTLQGDESITLRESEVTMLEFEKSSIQKTLDDVIHVATKDNISYVEKHEAMELLMELQIIESEVQSSRNSTESICAVWAELFQCVAVVSDMILELNTFVCGSAAYLRSITSNHHKLHSYMEKQIIGLDRDKSIMYHESINLHKKVQELTVDLHEAESLLAERCQQQDLEKAEFLSKIGNLEKEISSLSSSSLAREKEILRKELDKTRLKLKETEFKLKNAMQEKTKLEGEKAQAEREIKHLHGQKVLLERDICKRDSFAGRRRDSFADRRRESKAFESSKANDHCAQFEQTVQGEYKKLEVLAFEMETTIASLEEELAAVNGEKEEAYHKNDSLAEELETTSNKLLVTNSELNLLQQEVSSIRVMLFDSESLSQKLESSINQLQGEKEELAMQLAEALLEMDEERAIWLSKEKASIESITEKTKLPSADLTLPSKEISEDLKSQLSIMLKERDQLLARNEELQKLIIEMELLKTDYEDLLLKARADEEQLKIRISSMETETHNIAVNNKNDKAKLKIRLRASEAKLDAFKGRYNEVIDEMGLMNRKYEEASGKLKEQLASYGVEILHLKKSLAARSG